MGKDETKEKLGLLRASGRTLRLVLPQIIIFEIFCKAVYLLAIKPVLLAVLQFMLNTTGFLVAFNNNIWEFFFTFQGLAYAVIWAASALLFAYYEYSVVITLLYSSANGHPATLLGAMRCGRETFVSLKSPSTFLLGIYILGLIPLADIGLASSIAPGFAIPNFITGELSKTAGGNILISLAMGLLTFIVLLFVFTLPIMILDGVSFAKAIKKNFGFMKKAKSKLLFIFAVCFLIWLVVFKAPRAVFTSVFNTSDVSVQMIWSTFGLSWQTLVLVVVGLAFFAAYLLIMPMLFSVVITGYYRNTTATPALVQRKGFLLDRWAFNRLTREKVEAATSTIVTNKWFKFFRAPVAILLVLALGFGILRLVESGLGLHSPIVIGHRGSDQGVENTLEAIQGAIDAGADYAEVDILLSSDGVPMVVHDTNLLRLAGKDVNVFDLTAEQLSKLELRQNGQVSHMPTLDEAVRFCAGKIKLAIEFKLHGKEKANLVDEVLRVIDEHGFLRQSMFLSLEYTLIEELNTKRPESFGGYCVYGGVGVLDPYVIRTMKIDFIVAEEAMVSVAVIKAFRRSWLPVYVWTVNDSANMQRYLDMGILGIVTDSPQKGVAAVAEYNQRSSVIYLPEEEQFV